jgi:hypothetical protein
MRTLLPNRKNALLSSIIFSKVVAENLATSSPSQLYSTDHFVSMLVGMSVSNLVK